SVAAVPVHVEGTMNAGVLDALPRSELDVLRQSPQGASTPAAPRPNELDTSFKLRDLTLPYSAFATTKTLPSAEAGAPDTRRVGGDRIDDIGVDRNFPGIGTKGLKLPGDLDSNPRADGDDDSGKQVLGSGFKLPGGVILPGGVVPGGDPDNNPRADYG